LTVNCKFHFDKVFLIVMYQVRVLLAELFLIALATTSAVFLIDNFEVSQASIADFAPRLLLTLATAMIVLPSFGTYRSVWRFTGLTDYLRILAATGAIVAGASALGFWFNRPYSSGLAIPVLQGLLMLFFLVGVRVVARVAYAARERMARRKASREASGDETILVIGLGALADLYLRFLAQYEPRRVRIGGLLGDIDRQIGCCIHGHKILGTPEHIAVALRNLEIHGVFVDRIVLTTPFEQLSPKGQAALLDIETSTNINLDFLADEVGLGRGSRDNWGFAPGGTTKSFGGVAIGTEDLAALTRRPYWRVKRALDPLAALLLLIVLAPLLLLVAMLTAIDVGLPVTFWQLRPGLNGRLFKLHKFRTMAAAYDARGRGLAEEERASSIGQFLRRSRLDELPQLFSILSGAMSFIGPRPLLPVDQPAIYSARLLVRPGLTGWAQINGGRALSPADKAALDVWYVKNASLALDVKILAYTMRMVIFGEKVNSAAIQRAWRELREAGICISRESASEQTDSVASIGPTGREQVAQARAARWSPVAPAAGRYQGSVANRGQLIEHSRKPIGWSDSPEVR
jgi:lipopolysaccharide/colanic/teichoic acid biosynthesis glycosyltransferase